MRTTISAPGDSTPPPDVVIGAVIGNYVVVGKIGQGGMGAVYRARHQTLRREAAIKTLLPQFCGRPGALQRFFNEARALARLRHPALVEVYDSGPMRDGGAYLAMELLEGETLENRLDRDERLPLETALGILRELAGGVEAAHESGIVHRDLKPGNVFLARQGDREVVKVLDFGIAKLDAFEPDQVSHTQPGAVLGTPLFMAPEQCRDARTVDARTDVYSVACIAFFMLAGRPPFEARNLADLVAAQITDEPPALDTLVPGVPPAVARAVARGLSHDPDDRQPSVASFIRDLEGLPEPPPKAARWTRRRLSLAALAVTVGASALVAPRAYESFVRSRLGLQLVDAVADASVSDELRVAMDARGKAIVAWAQKPKGDHEQPPQTSLHVRLQDEAGSWGAPTKLETKGNVDQIVLDENGRGQVALAWTETPIPRTDRDVAGPARAWTRRFFAGHGFGDPVALHPAHTSSKAAAVAVDREGRAYALWVEDEGHRQVVRVAEADPDGKWKTPKDLQAAAWASAKTNDIALAATAADRAIAVWLSGKTDMRDVYAAERSAEGRWGEPVLLATARAAQARASAPRVALDERGAALAVWKVTTERSQGVREAHHEPGAPWVSTEIAMHGDDSGYPEVALSGRGEALLVWRCATATKRQNLWFQELRGGVWTRPALVEHLEGVHAQRPELAGSDDGRALLVFQVSGTKGFEVWSAVWDGRTGLSAPARLGRPEGTAREPRAAAAGQHMGAVWLESAPERGIWWKKLP